MHIQWLSQHRITRNLKRIIYRITTGALRLRRTAIATQSLIDKQGLMSIRIHTESDEGDENSGYGPGSILGSMTGPLISFRVSIPPKR